jgi:hypothetical protein
MVAMAFDLAFQDGRKVRLREHESSDLIGLHSGLGAHRLLINLQSETIAGVDPKTYPLVDLAGQVHCINHRNLDRWVGVLGPTSIILRPDDIATSIADLVVTLDDTTVFALDEAIDGQDFQLRLDLRADLTNSAAWPRAEGQMTVRVPYSNWQRQLTQLRRTLAFTVSIPIPMTEGPLALAGQRLVAAERKLVAGERGEAVRLLRLAQEAMRQSKVLPRHNFEDRMDERTLDEKYGNVLWSIFELDSVPQHNNLALQELGEQFNRADVYTQFWMTAAMYYKLVDATRP